MFVQTNKKTPIFIPPPTQVGLRLREQDPPPGPRGREVRPSVSGAGGQLLGLRRARPVGGGGEGGLPHGGEVRHGRTLDAVPRQVSV